MKGIPMTAQDVRALLTCAKCGKISVLFPCEHCGSEDFLKTQTRRVIKPQPLEDSSYPCLGHYTDKPKEFGAFFLMSEDWHIDKDKPSHEFRKSPYHPGDVVYVKEAFCDISVANEPNMALYKATDPEPEIFPWKSPLFMPRWAARIFEEITDVRVERVQEISEEDARAEGIWKPNYPHCFKKLWNSINKTHTWESNPWVFVYGLKRRAG